MANIKDERGFNQIFEDTLAARIRKQRRCDYIISKMKNIEAKDDVSILEIGCGTGEAIHYIQQKTKAKCFGLDLSNAFVESADKNFGNERLNFVSADFNDQKSIFDKFGQSEFDYVVGNGILHHLYYGLDQSLLGIMGLLKKGGKIIFIEPNIYNPYVALIFKVPFFREMACLEPDEMAFSSFFIKRKLELANFISIDVEVRDFLLPNIPDFAIDFVCTAGDLLEKTPLTFFAQSVFVSAEK